MKSLFLVSPNPFYFDTPNNKIPMVIKKTALFMIFPRYNYDRIVHIFPWCIKTSTNTNSVMKIMKQIHYATLTSHSSYFPE